MNALTQIIPAMRELEVSNPLLGDHRALAEAWDRDGYWFFRDVLNTKVIGEILQVYVDYLVQMGLVDPEAPDVRYNGADYSHLPVNSGVSQLNERKAHTLLHQAPTINAFFLKLFGCDPFWVPFTVHRANPPVIDRTIPRFDLIHEDGIYNDGLPFLICWVPLDHIDEEVGGIAVVEGVHKGPCLHRRDGMTIHPIRFEDIPAGRWRRSDYGPGDVLLMSLRTPHSGLSNISKDRFRFSLDTRIMPSTGKVPVVGTITEISSKGARIADANGGRSLRFDEHSFVRGHRGDQMALADVPARYHPGSEIIAAVDGDRVVNMRPQT